MGTRTGRQVSGGEVVSREELERIAWAGGQEVHCRLSDELACALRVPVREVCWADLLAHVRVLRAKAHAADEVPGCTAPVESGPSPSGEPGG